MYIFPKMHQLKSKKNLDNFSQIYSKASGLPIPDSYLYNTNNRVFGIYWKQTLIGGFILGRGLRLRTISLFAKEEKQGQLYQQLGNTERYTEICCFWIKKAVRTKTYLNFFIWLSMAFALKRYATKDVIFGTCSRSLARLYSATSQTKLISRDFINRKATFIFLGKQQFCFLGILEIIQYKLKRILKIPTRTRLLFK